jgi:hypothetical protein
VVWAQTLVNMRVGDPHQPKTTQNKTKALGFIGLLYIYVSYNSCKLARLFHTKYILNTLLIKRK